MLCRPLKRVHFAYSYYSFLFGFYIRNVFLSILERLMSRQGLDPTDDVLMAFFLIDALFVFVLRSFRVLFS